MKKSILILTALLITLGLVVAKETDFKRVFIQKEHNLAGSYTDYFAYASSDRDTSRNTAIYGYTEVWVDYYVEVESSTTVTLAVDLLGQYESGGNWYNMHTDAATESAITASTYGRFKIRVADTVAFSQPYLRLDCDATITGDSATVWFVISAY